MNFKKNIQKIKNIFEEKKDPESKYLALIELGKELPPLDPKYKTSKYLIIGCQSTTYLYSYLENDLIYFKADSNTLISKGLVALLILAYEGQKPEVIIKNKPTFLEELGINASLSPNRANGLHQMYKKMVENALSFIK